MKASVLRGVGDEPGVPCRSCAQCLAGRYNLCPEMRFFATPPYDGAFCEYVAMPAAFVHAVPDSISDDAAGPIGLVCAQGAFGYGASEVVVTDVNPHRLQLARTLGATALDVSDRPVGATGFEPDVLLECSGHPRPPPTPFAPSRGLGMSC